MAGPHVPPQHSAQQEGAEACFVHAWAAFSTGDFDAALQAFTEAIQLDPAFVQAHVDRAGVHETLEALPAALDGYSAALVLSPDDAWIYILRGGVHVQMDNHPAALADYATAIRLQPEEALAYSRRGDVYHALGNLDAAIADYTAALTIDPRQNLAYAGRAAARAALWGSGMDRDDGVRAAALEDYERYLRLRPDAPDRAEVEAAIGALRRTRDE
ncbi:MAG TPA: tetratricopeptide repeat protein [Herpetosiphonaceae bacterium]|nr:tetratricopeptide repeat protein [Herpetosiphonaceae bacterium]